MNYDNTQKSFPFRAGFQWWTLLALFGIILTFTNCSKQNDIEDEIEKFPSLKIANAVTDGRYISSVKMVNYQFSNLNITSGNSQTFSLENGMPAGLSDINVIVTYRRTAAGTPSNSLNKDVNFENGNTKTLTLSGCLSYEGCKGYKLD